MVTDETVRAAHRGHPTHTMRVVVPADCMTRIA